MKCANDENNYEVVGEPKKETVYEIGMAKNDESKRITKSEKWIFKSDVCKAVFTRKIYDEKFKVQNEK